MSYKVRLTEGVGNVEEENSSMRNTKDGHGLSYVNNEITDPKGVVRNVTASGILKFFLTCRQHNRTKIRARVHIK